MKSRKACYTDAGMFAVWDSRHFDNIVDYDSWEYELLEDNDIIGHVEKGYFVPINLHSDGCYEFEVRTSEVDNAESLSPRELKYLTVSSAPYYLRSEGLICFGGYEYISNDPTEDVGVLEVQKGDYKVVVNLMAWDNEPGSKDASGKPMPNALPDFIVNITPAQKGSFKPCLSLETFPQPPE